MHDDLECYSDNNPKEPDPKDDEEADKDDRISINSFKRRASS